jgi:hypothetical protein
MKKTRRQKEGVEVHEGTKIKGGLGGGCAPFTS